MLLNNDWMSADVTPMPANQDSSPLSSCWICVEYCGSRVANCTTPTIDATNNPTTIANTVRNTPNEATPRLAPRRSNHPRIGFTVMVNTSAKKTGPMIPGIARIPWATTTPPANPSTMIKPRGSPYRDAARRFGSGLVSTDSGPATPNGVFSSVMDSHPFLAPRHHRHGTSIENSPKSDASPERRRYARAAGACTGPGRKDRRGSTTPVADPST